MNPCEYLNNHQSFTRFKIRLFTCSCRRIDKCHLENVCKVLNRFELVDRKEHESKYFSSIRIEFKQQRSQTVFSLEDSMPNTTAL